MDLVKLLCQIDIMGIRVSFSFVGSVGSELPFSTWSPESCYIGKGNQGQQRIFLCLLYDPVTPVKVDYLIYGKNMAGRLISNQH
jgi:hypothetical protein